MLRFTVLMRVSLALLTLLMAAGCSICQEIIFPTDPEYHSIFDLINSRPENPPDYDYGILSSSGSSSPNAGDPVKNINELSADQLRRLNNISEIDDFLDLFNMTVFSTSLRFGISVPQAQMANCIPELQTVSLDPPEDPSFMYYPTCVRLKRCGGCCFGPLVSCQASSDTTVRMKVLKINTDFSNDVTYETVVLKEHTKCSCQCKVKPGDCNPQIHDHDPTICSCVCKNQAKKEECESKAETHIWDSKSCQCFCNSFNNTECSTGQYFSQEECRCVREGRRLL